MGPFFLAALVLVAAPTAFFWTVYLSPFNILSWFKFIPAVKERMGDFVTTPSGRACYRHRGKGKSKRLLVMLAGIGHDGSYWPELLDYISERHELISIDLFGRGFTDAGRAPYTIDTYAQLVQEVLAALKLDGRSLVVCGFSFGGAVAAHVAATTNTAVGALLVVPAGVVVTPHFANYCKLARTVPRGIIDIIGVVGSVLSLLYVGSTGRTEATCEPGYAERLRKVWVYSFQDFLLNPSFFRAYLHTLRNVALGGDGRDIKESYKRLRRLGPNVQLLLADTDSIIPAAELEAFAKEELPEARILKVEGGHDVQWDRPRKTSEQICEFLASLKDR